jgi:eukaryotic-like serine/threonine-protein kinase
MRCPLCRELLPEIERAKFCPSCGQELPDEAPVDPMVGRLIGSKYQVTELVAEGGMGRIYAAEQTMGTTRRKVAIKMLLAEYASRPQDVARFMRECSTVCELEHPNTIKFYDYGQSEEGDLYIVMEFLTGESLASALKTGGAMPAERVDWIVGQICGSLQEAHDKGIIHRDLKPDNILLTTPAGEPDVVKVLDFGIAKRPGGRDQRLTPLGVVLGSPPYMSPEQFSLQDIDAKSDIYSLGVVAYQALTGKLPFRARDMMQWATLHMTEPPRPFETTQAGLAVPLVMRDAILAALAKDPADRPPSMRGLYERFTIGAGKSMPPARARTGELPPPPPAEHDRPPPRSMSERSHPPGWTSELSLDSVDQSVSRGGAEGRAPSYGKSGTLSMASSHPPPANGQGPFASHLHVPELLPPTVREPVSHGREGGGRAVAATVLMIAGAVAVAGGLIYAGVALSARDSGSEIESPPRADDTPAGRTASTSSPVPLASALPSLLSAVPTRPPPREPSAPVDPCEETIAAAMGGDCDTALRMRHQCPADHPDHALAHRAYERRCPSAPH